ncbi:3'(2'),5'-bisphosphate nucleotidase CysQ [Francisellaceae bacterium]|nr:3'(2'),5'-bisphosphate nucleotidase CysQ [Francisellaceae bacterium]
MLNKINIEDIKSIARTAGKDIMEIYRRDFHVELKEDKSPLTEADIKANEIICDRLKELYPNIPILSEEGRNIPYSERNLWDYFWLIDPIDGTKEFIKKTGEFTVNIALIHGGKPVLGVVYAPEIDDLYWAKQGEGAYKNSQKLPLIVNEHPEEKLTVVASASHPSKETQDFIGALETQEVELIAKGSSLKLCMVAEGVADIYPRLAPTMEWDTAAAHAVVLEARKEVVQYGSKESLVYNKENLLNPWFVVR